MIKAITLTIALALSLSASSAVSQSNSSADALVDYFFRLANLKGMLRIKVDSNPAFNTEERKILKSIVNNIDIKDLVAMFSPSVSSAFTNEELEVCTQMVSTPALAKSLDISDKMLDTENPVDVLMAKLNKSEQDEVVAYFDTNCFLRTGIVMGSQENQQKLMAFGYSHICNSLIRERVDILTSNEFLKYRCEAILHKDLTTQSSGTSV
jgi:hypothetical protein